MGLDPKIDYGFSVHRATNIQELPVWDQFRFEKIQEIFRTSSFIIDFSDSSRALTGLLKSDLHDKTRVVSDVNFNYAPNVVSDICSLPFQDESVDGIVCAAILEHVYNPFIAADELYRVLAPQGKLFVYVPWMYQYHAPSSGDYADYYRFSQDGIRYLFRKFPHIEVSPVRGKYETIFNFFPFLGKRSRFHRMFRHILYKFDLYGERYTSGFNIFLTKGQE